MQLKNTDKQFGIITKFLHWIIAILMIAEIVLVYGKRFFLPEKSPLGGFLIGGLHKPIGILILYLGVFFVIWRFFNPQPKLPTNMPAWQKAAASISKFLLYACIIIMPVAGVLMSVAAGYPPSFFGLFQIPMFMEKNKEIAELFYAIHANAGFVLMGVICIHIAAALKHHFMDRNDVLKRML